MTLSSDTYHLKQQCLHPLVLPWLPAPLHLMRPTLLELHPPTSLPSLPVLLHSALLDVFPLVTNVVAFATLPFWTLLSTGKPLRLSSWAFPPHLLTPSSRTDDDVFLSAPTPTAARGLSPTAEVFTPGQTTFKTAPTSRPSLLTESINAARQTAGPFSLPAECINAAGEANWRDLVLPYADIINAEVAPAIVTPARVSSLSLDTILDLAVFLTCQRFYTHGQMGGPALSPDNCPALTPEYRGRHEFEMRRKMSAMGMRMMLRVGNRFIARDLLCSIEVAEGSFTTDEHIFRSFIVSGIPHDYPTAAIAAHFSVCLLCLSISIIADNPARCVSIIEIHQCCSGSSRGCFHRLFR